MPLSYGRLQVGMVWNVLPQKWLGVILAMNSKFSKYLPVLEKRRFLSPPVHITRLAHMHHFLSVRLSVSGKNSCQQIGMVFLL